MELVSQVNMNSVLKSYRSNWNYSCNLLHINFCIIVNLQPLIFLSGLIKYAEFAPIAINSVNVTVSYFIGDKVNGAAFTSALTETLASYLTLVGKTKSVIPSVSTLVNAFTEKDDTPAVAQIPKVKSVKSSLNPIGLVTSGKSRPSKKTVVKKVKKGLILKKLLKPFVKKVKKLIGLGKKIFGNGKNSSSGSQNSGVPSKSKSY